MEFQLMLKTKTKNISGKIYLSQLFHKMFMMNYVQTSCHLLVSNLKSQKYRRSNNLSFNSRFKWLSFPRMMTNKFRCQGVATKNQINMALILDTQKM